jgi:hypothetical protein
MQASSRRSARSAQGGYPIASSRSRNTDNTGDTSVYGFKHIAGYGGHQPDHSRNAGKLGKSFGSRTDSSSGTMYTPESRNVGVGAHLAHEIKKAGIPLHEYESQAIPRASGDRFLPQEGYSGHQPKALRNQEQLRRLKSTKNTSSGPI